MGRVRTSNQSAGRKASKIKRTNELSRTSRLSPTAPSFEPKHGMNDEERFSMHMSFLGGYRVGGTTHYGNPGNSVSAADPRMGGSQSLGKEASPKLTIIATEAEDNAGCMLHDIGEDCLLCGEVAEMTNSDGKNKWMVSTSHRLDIGQVVGPGFGTIDFGPDAFACWLTGLGQAQQTRSPAAGALQVEKCCASCGADISNRMTDWTVGPGGCVESRYRWLAKYLVEEAKAAARNTKK